MQVRAEGRAASRSGAIGRLQVAHVPYSPASTRASASSTSASRRRAESSRAATCWRSNAMVAPYGVYRRVLASGEFTELPGTGSLRLLRRTSSPR
jgi:hypothetical protein